MFEDILKIDNPKLRQFSQPFDFNDQSAFKHALQALKNALHKVKQDYDFQNTAGLSLVQLGILQRGCIVQFASETPTIMLNPQIIQHSLAIDYKYEGCLSFFDQRGLVPRYSAIEVQYYDEDLQLHKKRFAGWPARLIQHEIDHMDGILYIDHMDKAHSLLALSEFKKVKPYSQIQNLAKDTIFELLDFIRPGVTESQIATKAKNILESKGITEFWYYNVAALVLVGKRSILSLSGRNYQPTDSIVQANDLVTVDLSPLQNGIWGDYARTIYMEDGHAKLEPTQQPEFKAGYYLTNKLHAELLKIASPDLTAHQLWQTMNAMIADAGFINLDFKNNLGHSIETKISARRYIEEGNHTPLKDFGLFTFEPHISRPNDKSGFKHENIYYFAAEKLQLL